MTTAHLLKRARPLETPIAWDEHGVPRVAHTRVHLLYVLRCYKQGERPEEIVRQFPSLELADVYAVIAYYLRNREEMDEFHRDAEKEEERAVAEMQARNPDPGFLDRIYARAESQRKNQAP